MKYFVGYRAWREAFWAMMAIEQPEEIAMSASENCLPDNYCYVSKTENDAPAPGLDVGPRKGISQKGKKRYNTKAATRDSND